MHILFNLKTVSIRIFHSTESMLSPLIVHAYPYAASFRRAAALSSSFHENLSLFFLFGISLLHPCKKSRRVKNAKKRNKLFRCLGIFSIEWTQVEEKKMYETRKIGGLISLLESALPKRLGLASVSSFLTLPVTQIFLFSTPNSRNPTTAYFSF